jgi:hypothetical protein
VSGFAVGRERGENPGALLRLGQRRAAETEAGRGQALEPAEPDLLQPVPPCADPGGLMSGEERPGGDVVGDSGRAPGGRPASFRDAGLRPVRALQGRLDVDEGLLRKEQLDLRAPLEPPGAQGVPQLGQQHVQRASRLRGGVLSPTRHQQLVTQQRAAPVEHEVGEEEPPSASRQRTLDPGTVDVDREPPTQLDPGLDPLRHGMPSLRSLGATRGCGAEGKLKERSSNGSRMRRPPRFLHGDKREP